MESANFKSGFATLIGRPNVGNCLLYTSWDMEGLEHHLPGQVKKFIADHNIKFYVIDGIKIGKEIGLDVYKRQVWTWKPVRLCWSKPRYQIP